MHRLAAGMLAAGVTMAAATTSAMAQVDTWTVETITSKEDQAAINRKQAVEAQKTLQQSHEAYEEAIQAYENALQERENLIRSRQEEYDAEVARRAKEHEEAMDRWREDVAACEAGDETRCAQKE